MGFHGILRCQCARARPKETSSRIREL
jgi:hypothetical protein